MRRWLMVAALACCLLLPHLARAQAVVTVDAAIAVQSDAQRPQDVDFAAASGVLLPDNWQRNRPGLSGTVWYRIPLDASLRATGVAAGEPLALVVTRLADTGTAWLNGERLDVGAAGDFTRNRPVWIPVPAHALREKGNTLLVRVSGHAVARGGLSQLSLGPPGLLRTDFELRRLLQTVVPQTLMFSVVICLFGASALWLKSRRRIDLVFAGLCLTWLPRALVMLSPTAGAPGQGGLLFALGSTFASNVLIVLLLLDYARWRGPFWQRYLRIMYAVVAVCFAVGAVLAWDGDLRPALLGVLHWPFFALALVPFGAQVRRAWRTRVRSEMAMAATLVLWSGSVVHDLAIAADATAFDSFFWAPITGLLVLLNLVWRGLESLALHRASAEHEINRAVAHASTAHGLQLQQIRAEFDRAQVAERQAVLAAERTRLLHDLHDGLGSQLITALRMTRREQVPRDEVARIIEDSLEDMRLIIDSLDVEERDLLPLLGNLRYRLEPRLNAIGVALHWQAEALPELSYLSPETGLAIVRIVQEAVNNAVRHGNARNITVRTHGTASAIELTVRDDGRGFDAAQPPRSGAPQRGLGAMRSRAGKLGGTLAIESGGDGTRVHLTLPLSR